MKFHNHHHANGYLTKLDDFFSLHQISRWNQMKQNISESFLLHFCTEMSQKSWNFHRQFHFLQCNSIRKMKRNSPWAPEYLVTLIGFPFHLWKKCFFILQGSCKDSFPFPSFPYLTHYGPFDSGVSSCMCAWWRTVHSPFTKILHLYYYRIVGLFSILSHAYLAGCLSLFHSMIVNNAEKTPLFLYNV